MWRIDVKNRVRWGIAFCLLLSQWVHADAWLVSDKTNAAVAALTQQARENNQAYDIMTSLTTEVGPRLAGSEAEARARAWAVTKMEALGLVNVRIEPFDVPVWERGVERAEILSPFPQPLVITALGGSTSTGPEGVEAEVVAFPDLATLEQASPDEVAGRIVFVDEAMARSRDGSGYAAAVGKRYEAARLAQRLGGVATLIRSVGTTTHRFAHTGHMGSIGGTTAQGVPAAALAAPDADQLARALGYGQPVVVRMTLTPQTRPASSSGNVIGEIRGSEFPQEIVLLGAHLDSWDLGTGAVDDGAGVGIVLGAAKAFSDFAKTAPRRTIRVVLFGSEEVGLVGARAYAQAHATELDNHIVGSESDFGAGDIWRIDTRFAQDKQALAEMLAASFAPLGITRGGNDARGGPDMKYLREAGVPMVTFMQDGSDYFDLHHTPNDTLDKVAPQALDQNVAAYAAFLYLIANSTVSFR